MQNLSLYRASAGSGKTHLLTQNYLRLAFQNPNNFSKILAVTFTNKAAEEMKDRIIAEINNIITEKSKAAHFIYIQNFYSGESEQEIVAKAQAIRDNILHNYSMFSVSTIDSFVQKVVRAFAFETGLGANYQIEMDNSKVIADLTEMLYTKISKDKALQAWLIRFAKYKIDEGKNWDFRNEIGGLANEIFKEKFQSFQPFSLKSSKGTKQKQRDKLSVFLSIVQEIRKNFEQQMEQLSIETIDLLEKNSIVRTALGSKFKIITGYFIDKIPKGEYDPFSTQTVEKALNGIENWHTKTAKPAVVEQITSVYEPLLALLHKAISIYNADFSKYITAKSTLSNFHTFGLLSDIAALLPEYRKQNNVLLISDTTLLLKEIISHNDAPFIYEKIGNRFSNVLIDEFQDTSSFQWENFKPLIVNSLAEGFYNLIVGDVKQSIYRWRAGDWKLLLSGVSQDIGDKNINEQSLDTNWRSKKNIVDFNNSVFEYAPKTLQNHYNNQIEAIKFPEVRQQLEQDNFKSILIDAYADSYQKLPANSNKIGGRVTATFIQTKGTEYNETVGQKFPAIIDALLKQKNYTAKDITILVRAHREGQAAVRMMQDYQAQNKAAVKYSIISAQSLYLKNSPYVRVLANAMKYLFDAENPILLSTLAYDFMEIRSIDQDFHSTFSAHLDIEEISDFLPLEFIENQEQIKQKSLYEISEKLISIFKLTDYPEGFPYLQAFQDAVLDYTRNNSSDLGAFITWWNEKGKMLSVRLSDKQNAVKVVTIHHSKGLAYKVVIMPFVNWKIDHTSAQTAPIIWAKSGESPFNAYEYLPIKYKKELAKSLFSKDYFDEKLYASMDAINMLYVAFTRSIEELHIFAPISKSPDKISHCGDLLFKTIQASKGQTDGTNTRLINLNQMMNDDAYFESCKGYIFEDNKAFRKDQSGNEFGLEKYPNNDWSDRVSINYSSDDFFIESIDSVAEKVNYGILMHRIFSEIITEKDVEGVLENLYFAGYLTGSERKELKRKVQTIIAKDNVKPWFSGKYEIITEQAILTKNGEIRIPDRVLLSEDEITVIDFKFGAIREEYELQIKEYQLLLSEIYNKKVSGIIYYAESDTVVEIKA